LRENRKAEEKADGKAGTPNPSGRYFSEPGTLNEKRIPREEGFAAVTPISPATQPKTLKSTTSISSRVAFQ
jgi:hypothetical protein